MMTWFDPIVVSGPNTSLPHGVPGDRRLQKGDFITMDFGVLYRGYCSDMTRTVALGHATEKMREVYQTVLKAQLAGLAVSKAGVAGKAVEAIGRNPEAEGKIRSTMILGIALSETCAIYGLLVAILLIFVF